MALTQSPSLSNNPKGFYQPYDFYRDVQCLYTMCILGLLHVNLYCADTIMCWPIVQVPSADAAGEHWQNRGGERYQGQHAEYGLCNDSPEYFACHVITCKILLLNLFLYNCKHIQVVKMNVNSSLPTIFIDAGIQSWLGLPYCIIIQIKRNKRICYVLRFNCFRHTCSWVDIASLNSFLHWENGQKNEQGERPGGWINLINKEINSFRKTSTNESNLEHQKTFFSKFHKVTKSF